MGVGCWLMDFSWYGGGVGLTLKGHMVAAAFKSQCFLVGVTKLKAAKICRWTCAGVMAVLTSAGRLMTI